MLSPVVSMCNQASIAVILSDTGVVEVDLFTLATGPMQHELPISDGPLTRGTLTFDVDMQQQTFISIVQSNVEAILDEPHDALHPVSGLQLKFSYTDNPQSGARKTKAMPPGTLSFRDLDRVRCIWKYDVVRLLLSNHVCFVADTLM